MTAVSEDGGHVAECIVTVTEKEVDPPETGAVSMVLTGAMLVVAGIAVNMGKRRKSIDDFIAHWLRAKFEVPSDD